MYMTPIWRLIETYHAVVYYAPERRTEYESLGFRGGWMGYFASRAGALGPVGPDVVTVLFYNFNRPMVARALPDAWTYSTPEAALAARLRVADRALRRLLGNDVASEPVLRAAALCRRAVEASPETGRTLFAAHRALPVPEEPHLALFWAASALREFRGDGHNAALLHADIDGCEAHVLMTALGLVPPDQRRYRGWSDEDWEGAAERLRSRGWIRGDRLALTEAGQEARAAVERDTERLAAAPLAAVDAAGVASLAVLLAPLVSRIGAGGDLPYPNGMGVPPATEVGQMS
jgi:hypothetical protein